jgi:hypothetical protein
MVRVAQRLQDLVTRRHTLVKPSTTIQTCQANTHRHVNRQVTQRGLTSRQAEAKLTDRPCLQRGTQTDRPG